MDFKEYVNRRVLIVDDQKEIHDDFAEMLKPQLSEAWADKLAAAFVVEEEQSFLPEFELLHARSGEEACEILRTGKERTRPIAVAYIDIRMPPGIDGIETIRRMREVDRDVEIVIMTAHTDRPLPEIIQNVEPLHKVLYIRKPFAREEIQQMTLSLVGKWNVEQELAEKRRQLATSHQRLEAVLDTTGEAMGMYDLTGRLVFANRRYEELADLTESELKELSPDALAAQFEERFREPDLPDVEGRFVFKDGGDLVEESAAGTLPEQRLFYRSTAPVQDGQGEVMGSLYVYRDVSKEVEVERMKAEVLRLRTELETTYSFDGLVGASPPMQKVYTLMRQAAESDITVLVRGESGTGKELVAKSFHLNSPRKDGPFLAINCAAIPEALMESELFGHERGAFTGATRQRIGAFERGRGGDDPSRRDRRHAAGAASQAVAGAAGEGNPASGWGRHHPHRRPSDRGHQQGPGGRGQGGGVPGRPVLSHRRVPHRDSAAQAASYGHSLAGQPFSQQTRRRPWSIHERHLHRGVASAAPVRLARQRARAR